MDAHTPNIGEESHVERALFSGIGEDGAMTHEVDMDAYDRFAVEDILPESRRGSRSLRLMSTAADEDHLVSGDNTVRGENREGANLSPDDASTHSETRHDNTGESDLPALTFVSYTAPSHSEETADPDQAQQAPSGWQNSWHDNQWENAGRSSATGRSELSAEENQRSSLPPSWMRSHGRDGPTQNITFHNDNSNINTWHPQVARVFVPVGGDDPFSGPSQHSADERWTLGPSAPEDDYSSHNVSATTRSGAGDDSVHSRTSQDEPALNRGVAQVPSMTVIEVGGDRFGPGLTRDEVHDRFPPVDTLHAHATFVHVRDDDDDDDHDETHAREVDDVNADGRDTNLSPSDFFRHQLNSAMAGSDVEPTEPVEPVEPVEPDTLSPHLLLPPSSPSSSSASTSSSMAAPREALAATVEVPIAVTAAAAQPPTAQALRARTTAAKPRVTFRDEVEEFSAPRPPSSTTEDVEDDRDEDVDVRANSSRRHRAGGAQPVPPSTVLTADELQDMRLRSFMASAQPRDTRRGRDGDESNDGADADDPATSTLDFLKETTDVILPDFMNHMFASTSSFFERGCDKVAGAVPEALKKAAGRTQQGVSMALDFTSDIIGGAPAYIARAVPNAIMSAETKQLVFVDFINVMRCCVNVNLLVVPFIFRVAGLAGAIIVLAVAAVLGCYCSEAFFAAKNQLRDAAYIVTYGDVPRLTWGRWFTGLSMAYNTIFLIAFTAYAAANARVLLELMGMSGAGATALSVIIPPLCSFPFVMCKRARSISSMSTIATLLIVAAVVLLFVALPYGAVSSYTILLWPTSVTNFFVGLNIATYVFSPLSLAVPVERTMTPRRFTWLLRFGTLIEYLLAVAFGLCAFLALSSNTCSVLPVSIHRQMGVTLTMHNVDTGLSAVLFFAFLWFIPRVFFNVGELCDQRILGLKTIPTYWQFKPNCVRFLYLALASLVAYVVPYFGIWVALGGALGSSLAGILIPSALDYVRRERRGLLKGRLLRWWEVVLVFSCFLFGLAVLCVGGVLSIFAMWAVVQTGAITTC